ncbi:MAG: 3-methyladenine DNA glycosylase [Nitrospiraceae bacterium]|nr:MAG: 3-methyladenine DNA glycosylase [Nitrospiraceae bacterium]
MIREDCDIRTPEGLRAALDRIAEADPRVARALVRVGYPEPRVRPPGFATLLRIIVAQQLSTASAAAIWRRLEERLGGQVEPEAALGLGEDEVCAVGFSRRKWTYARTLAEAVASGRLDPDGLARLPEEEAVRRLVGLPGFGRWSAEIYLLFALGRADVFPAGDLALRVAFARLAGLDSRPDEQSLRTHVEPWRPLRGAGAIFLWHLYGAATLDGGR